MSRTTCPGPAAILIALVIIATAGCSAPEQLPAMPQATPMAVVITSPTPLPTSPTPIATTVPAPVATISPPVTTLLAATTPTSSATPTHIPESTLNARIVDARNKLEMFIDSDVADTVIIHEGAPRNCDVKKSRELGYLIDMNTGESTFIKGDYWSMNVSQFKDLMKTDRQYILIHTHPRMWVTCSGSGIYSLYTFSIGDLAATANLTKQGYHVKKLIAIADMDYRIWPYEDDDWKSEGEIRQAVARIESWMGKPFSYYDPVFEQTFYDVDNLMPYLAEELNYHYTINNNIIN